MTIGLDAKGRVMLCRALCLAACASFICVNPGAAQVREPTPQGQTLKRGVRPASNSDVERATRAYLDTIRTERQRARSDAYFEGGYWSEACGPV